jgi:hypothetical protein
MRRRRLTISLVASLAALAACQAAPSSGTTELERDLAEVRASSVDLAPRAPERTMVVSADELTGAAPERAAPRARPVARPRPRAVAPRPEPAPVASAVPTPAPAPAVEPAPPTPAPAAPAATGPLRRLPDPTPEPPGGWRSVDDVIRNAPFPIKP